MTTSVTDVPALIPRAAGDPDRRRLNIGPPNGIERRVSTRRATDALKMACPFCGVSESAVLRSRGSISVDQVRRRRQCAGCGERFPTSERVDEAALARELADRARQRAGVNA